MSHETVIVRLKNARTAMRAERDVEDQIYRAFDPRAAQGGGRSHDAVMLDAYIRRLDELIDDYDADFSPSGYGVDCIAECM